VGVGVGMVKGGRELREREREIRSELVVGAFVCWEANSSGVFCLLEEELKLVAFEC
jgi:hypothetical protein